tara:strand:- start:1347 stop:2273 length:927 start_codon:yes stop_codon:yes gene_type:complete
MLSLNDRNSISRRFPKLTYQEQKINKIVKADYYRCIPKGKKYYAWFTMYKNKNVCLLVDVITNNIHSFIYNVCFSSELFNSILYGTLFMIKKRPYFTIEKIYILKGNFVAYQNIDSQIKMSNDIMDNYLKPVSYNENGLTFGLPCMFKTYKEAMETSKTLPYMIYSIQFMFYKTNSSKNYLYKPTELYAYFQVKPDISNDIYHLYCVDDMGNEIKHSTALVKTYNISVLLNSLFRNIKENKNLDALEESDDEEEFENINLDKFVDLNKKHIMKCEFHFHFKKWVPLEKGDFKISTKKMISLLEKNPTI